MRPSDQRSESVTFICTIYLLSQYPSIIQTLQTNILPTPETTINILLQIYRQLTKCTIKFSESMHTLHAGENSTDSGEQREYFNSSNNRWKKLMNSLFNLIKIRILRSSNGNRCLQHFSCDMQGSNYWWTRIYAGGFYTCIHELFILSDLLNHS